MPLRRDLEHDLLARVDAEGAARAELERIYYEWLLAALGDAVRQVMLAEPRYDDWRPVFAWRRARVLEILDTIEDVQRDALALLERDQAPHDGRAARVGWPSHS